MERVEVVRGGASDLYGSSAIGGVVNVVPMRPTSRLAEVRSSYGGLGTYDTSALLETTFGRWGVLASGGAIGTDGFIQQAPFQRGPVDTISNMHGQNGTIDVERNGGPMRLFARGSGFNEAKLISTGHGRCDRGVGSKFRGRQLADVVVRVASEIASSLCR